MKLDNKCIKDNSGSTSVLIVILMLVLMAFGMAALTTSYASYKMSLRNSEFGNAYNQMEYNAVKVEYEILSMVETISTQIKKDSKSLDKNTYNAYMSTNGSTAILNYLRNTDTKLVNAAYEQDDINVTVDGKKRIGTLRYTISVDDTHPINLTVKLNIYAPPLLGYDSYKEFIEVVEWYEWQESTMQIEENQFDDLFDESN